MRRVLLTIVAAAAGPLVFAAAARAEGDVNATAVPRMPFPERGYVVAFPSSTPLEPSRVRVTEDGRPVRRLQVTPLAESGLRSAVVLAIDASESMAGAPIEAAVAAAREFVARRQLSQHIGVLVFNGDVDVLVEPTENGTALDTALDGLPPLEYGTRIYDGIDGSIELLQRSRFSTAAIVVLSDGADLGSRKRITDIIAAARRSHVRVFTVGLRGWEFSPRALRMIAEQTGGTYAEARKTTDLAGIYRTLAQRFAREYLVQYRSDAKAESHVDVQIAIADVGTANTEYTAPTPSRAAPYHRSLVTRFLLWPASTIVLALLASLIVAWAVAKVIRRPHTDVVERIVEFSDSRPAPASELPEGSAPKRRTHTGGWWARLDRDLEIARIDMSSTAVVGWTAAATFGIFLLLLIVSQLIAVLALLTPLVSRALIRRKLGSVRDDFADELPANLQVLASALRAGHSLSGALAVVVENAHEPARSELQRIVRDEQFGVPPDEAIRRVADRMANRDLEQVALLAELQRRSGGNAAEVLDVVVATIRERSELRRLVRSLTAQGRMARWILSALPIVLAAFLFLMRPDMMRILFESSGGQIALIVAALLVLSGSFVIQRIVDIDV
jgi:tight adherence protein B